LRDKSPRGGDVQIITIEDGKNIAIDGKTDKAGETLPRAVSYSLHVQQFGHVALAGIHREIHVQAWSTWRPKASKGWGKKTNIRILEEV